ncbi:hypothetical protein ACNKHW_19525 [Shigella flexneri]
MWATLYISITDQAKAGFGITFVPVAAIATTLLGAQGLRYQVGDKAHILADARYRQAGSPARRRPRGYSLGDVRIETRSQTPASRIPRPG